MSRLDDFHSKDFLEQVTLLNELSDVGNAEELPALMNLFENPLGDTSIDSMVVNALNTALVAHPGKALKGLASTNAGFRTLCIRVCGESCLPGSAPALMDLLKLAPAPDDRLDMLTALSRIGALESLPVFQAHLNCEDDLAAALSIETCGRLGDETSVPFFLSTLLAAEADDRFNRCDILTWKSISALAAIGTDTALAALAQVLHHRNPTARRMITDAMVSFEDRAVPYLLDAFAMQDKENADLCDQRILVSNLLGFIGAKAGAHGLVEAFDQGLAQDPNVRYALYEALGRIGSMKSIICLIDGLTETDELILMAVVGGLERQTIPGLIRQVSKTLKQGDAQSRRLARALIASKATRLFTQLYRDKYAANLLVTALTSSQDPEVVATFAQVLEHMEQHKERAKLDLDRLPNVASAVKTALIADDSKSMLALQRAILTDLGYTPTLAVNGSKALEHAESRAENEIFDLVITDMNMPVMDGMELIQHLRGLEAYATVPIIMVTTESEASQKALAKESGVTAFITKPFKPDDLKQVIAHITRA